MAGTRIERVEIAHLRTPLAFSFPVSYEDAVETEHVYVRVVTADGTVGDGEGAILPWFTGETATSAATTIEERFVSEIEGLSVAEALTTFDDIGSQFPHNSAAKTAVELALLDCRARELDVAVRDLLGTPRREAVPVVHAVGGVSADQAAESVSSALDAGHETVKVKATGDAAADRDRLNRVGDLVAEAGATMRIDANTAWTDYRGTVAALADVDLDPVEYLEQPVAADRTNDLRRVADDTGVPVFADESVHSAEDAIELAAARRVDGFCLKLAKSGGLRNFVLSARVASERGLAVTPVSAFGTSLEAAAILHAASVVPTIQSSAELFPGALERDPAETSLTVGTEARVPDGPGLGVRLEDELFAESG